MMRASPLLQHRATRVLPHIVDTLFLATGIALVVSIKLQVFAAPWLLAKLVGLVLYIGLGMVTMRFGRTREIRMLAFVGALVTFAYIVGVALAKTPASWLAYLA